MNKKQEIEIAIEKCKDHVDWWVSQIAKEEILKSALEEALKKENDLLTK